MPEQDKVLEVKLECLDNLTDLLKRFGRSERGERGCSHGEDGFIT